MPGAGLPRTIQAIIVLALAATPVFNAAEVYELFVAGRISQTVSVTPFYVKALKDVLMLLLAAAGLAYAIRRDRLFSNSLLYMLIILILAAMMVSVMTMPPVILLAGVRAMIPIFLILALWGIVDAALQARLARLLRALLVLAVALQVVQLVFFPPFWGTTFFGFSARNPGFFIIPSTMAAFASLTAFYVHSFLPRRRLNRAVVFLACPASIALTASASGLFAIIGIFGVWAVFAVREKAVVVALMLATVAGALALLPEITGRGDIYHSLAVRLGIFAALFERADLVASSSFGVGTNTAVGLLRTYGGVDFGTAGIDAMIADSTINSLGVNLGLLSIPVFLAAWLSLAHFSPAYWSFSVVLGVFGLTTVLLESFPLNMLFAVNFAYMARQKYAQRRAGRPDSPDPRRAGQERPRPA